MTKEEELKKEIEKGCKHKFEHKIIKGRSCNLKDKKEHIWLIHKCKKCGVETCGGLIEGDKNEV